MRVYEVTKEVIDQVLENQTGVESYGEPHHLLWYYDEKSGKYIGCDNVHAHAWMEEFNTKEKCIAWLLGEEFNNPYEASIFIPKLGKYVVINNDTVTFVSEENRMLFFDEVDAENILSKLNDTREECFVLINENKKIQYKMIDKY